MVAFPKKVFGSLLPVFQRLLVKIIEYAPVIMFVVKEVALFFD